MRYIAGYKYIKSLVKTNISQIILVEKYGIKYVLKIALKKEFNYLIEREYIFLKYLYPLGFTPKPVALGNIGKRIYLIREWIGGTTLEDFLKYKSHDVITEHLTKVLYLLYRIHTHGIILVDISPSNFLVNFKGKLYILDLGLAIYYKEKTVLQGTPFYLAPESISQQIYSFKTDLYSIGTMFYKLYTKKLPYHAPNIDALLFQQRHSPSLKNIPPLPSNLLSRILNFDANDRPTILESIKILNESPLVGQLLVDKNFPAIFCDTIDEIANSVLKKDVQIFNIFSPKYPEGFFSYIFKELNLRFGLKGYKTATNSYTTSANILIWDFAYSDNMDHIIDFNNKISDNQKLIVFSKKPFNFRNPSVYYMNLTFRKTLLEESIKAFFPFTLKLSNSELLPLYADINLKILNYLLPKNFPLQKNILKTLTDYLYMEYHDLIDFLSSFNFALPKILVHMVLLKNYNEHYTKMKEKSYTSLLLILELFGFIESTKTHFILLPLFNTLLRRGKVKYLETSYNKKTSNIYDRLEYLIIQAKKMEYLIEELRELLRAKELHPTHARIFLDILYETLKSPEIKLQLIKTKISLGFFKSAMKDWQKLTSDSAFERPPLLYDYIKLTISLGKYLDALRMLYDLKEPQAISLLIYAHALYSQFDKMEKIIQTQRLDTEDPYYHLAMGFFELIKNKNTILAKKHATRANELAKENPHAHMVATYLYGISMLESKNEDAAINILESITGYEEYGIEALLVNFQLGYIHFKRKSYLKATYYFEYSYYLAQELNNITLSTQAAFYLAHMYYHQNKLDITESYMEQAYKFHNLLAKEHQTYLFKSYIKLEVELNHYQKAQKLLNKHPETEKKCDFSTLATLYYALKDIKKLKKLKNRAKNREEKILISTLVQMLTKTKD